MSSKKYKVLRYLRKNRFYAEYFAAAPNTIY